MTRYLGVLVLPNTASSHVIARRVRCAAAPRQRGGALAEAISRLWRCARALYEAVRTCSRPLRASR